MAFGLQLQKHRPGASHQPRGAGPKATGGQFRSGGSQYGGVAAEAQVIVAGQIQQGGRASSWRLQLGGGGGRQAAQTAAPLRRQVAEAVAQPLAPGGSGEIGREGGGDQGVQTPGMGVSLGWRMGGVEGWGWGSGGIFSRDVPVICGSQSSASRLDSAVLAGDAGVALRSVQGEQLLHQCA